MAASPFMHETYGFLIVKNPKQNPQLTGLLEIMGHMVSNELFKVILMDRLHHQERPYGIENENDLCVQLFGGMRISTALGVIEPKDIERSVCGRLISYLVVKDNHTAPAMEIARALYGDSDDLDKKTENIRKLVARVKNEYRAVFGTRPLIISSVDGYCLNPEYILRTDLQEFDAYWKTSVETDNITEQVRSLKRIVKI